jgi:hypothetical protein
MKREDFWQALRGQHKFLTWMDKNPKQWTQCTSFAVVHPDHTFMCPQTNCFASMAEYYNKNTANQPDLIQGKPGNGRGSVAFIVGIQKDYKDYYGDEDKGPGKKRGAAEDLKYLDWVINRSPWSKAFVSKSAKYATLKRSVIMDAKAPSNLMVGGGVAIRRLWETLRIKKAWLDAVEAGVNEDLAYFLAASSQYTNNNKSIKWGEAECGHMNLAVQSMDLADLKAFLEHKPWHLNKSYSEDQSYQGYSNMFVKEKDRYKVGTAHVWIANNFPWKDEVAQKVDADAVANPFAAARPVRRETDYADVKTAWAKWAEFQHVLFKEIGYAQ